jgi:hypothetical protein
MNWTAGFHCYNCGKQSIQLPKNLDTAHVDIPCEHCGQPIGHELDVTLKKLETIRRRGDSHFMVLVVVVYEVIRYLRKR